MKVNIRGDKLVVTKAIKEQIESKLEKLDRYFEENADITASVVVKVKNLNQTIEVTVPTKKFTLRAEETSGDLYESIDKVIDKLERQIRKNKTKLNNKYKNTEVMDMVLNFDTDDEQDESVIVKRKNIEMKPMDEEEAVLQANLLGHDFFVFKNIDEECVSVLYARKEGSYGIINVK